MTESAEQYVVETPRSQIRADLVREFFMMRRWYDGEDLRVSVPHAVFLEEVRQRWLPGLIGQLEANDLAALYRAVWYLVQYPADWEEILGIVRDCELAWAE